MKKNDVFYEKKQITVSYGQNEVELNIDMNVGIGGEHWPAAHVFCNLLSIEQYSTFFHELFHNKTIIELGSGTALVSILLNKMYHPHSIVVTDLMSHIDLINENIGINAVDKCIGMEFDWCNIPSPCLTYDVILAFECVYREDLFEPLVLTLKELSTTSTIILIGLTRTFAKPKFFNILRQHHFHYTMIPHVSLLDDHSSSHTIDHNIGLFFIQRQQ